MLDSILQPRSRLLLMRLSRVCTIRIHRFLQTLESQQIGKIQLQVGLQ